MRDDGGALRLHGQIHGSALTTQLVRGTRARRCGPRCASAPRRQTPAEETSERDENARVESMRGARGDARSVSWFVFHVQQEYKVYSSSSTRWGRRGGSPSPAIRRGVLSPLVASKQSPPRVVGECYRDKERIMTRRTVPRAPRALFDGFLRLALVQPRVALAGSPFGRISSRGFAGTPPPKFRVAADSMGVGTGACASSNHDSTGKVQQVARCAERATANKAAREALSGCTCRRAP